MSQIRIARPTRELAATVSFYADAAGFPVLASFDDHDGPFVEGDGVGRP